MPSRSSCDDARPVHRRSRSARRTCSTAWRRASNRRKAACRKHGAMRCRPRAGRRTLAGQHARALGEATATFERHSGATLAAMRESHAGLQAQLAARDEERLAAWNDSLAAMAAKLGDEWQRAPARTAQAASRKSATHWRKRRAISPLKLRRSNNVRASCCRRSAIRTSLQTQLARAMKNACPHGTIRWPRWPRSSATNGSAQACWCGPSARNLRRTGANDARSRGAGFDVRTTLERVAVDDPRFARALRTQWLHATRNASLRGTTRWSRWPRNWVTNGSAQACLARAVSRKSATHWRKRRAT